MEVKAEFTGAKTVRGSVPLRAPTKSAATNAPASSEVPAALVAKSTMVCGASTLSMAWMIPFVAAISATTTVASLLIETALPVLLISILSAESPGP